MRRRTLQVVLIGPRTAGKTTIGQMPKERLAPVTCDDGAAIVAGVR